MAKATEQAIETAAVDAAVAAAPGIVAEIAKDVEHVIEKVFDLAEQEIDNYRRAHEATPYVQPSHTDLPAADAADETEAK